MATTNSNYDIEQFQYPTDLSSSNEYGGHRVMFFINVLSGGKIARTDKNDMSTMAIPESELTSVNERAQKVFAEAVKPEAGSILNVLAPKRRLKAAVSLYVPNALTTSYSVNWSEESSESMMGGETMLRGILGAVEQPSNSAGSDVDDALARAKNASSPVASMIATKVLNGMPYVQKASGIAPGQSKAQQLFRNVDFREFAFQYEFAPKSSEEAKKVLNIIRLFRHHMLPEYFDANQYLYIYPSEFEVKYYIKEKENELLEKYATAVLTSMNINYTPNGQFMTFADGMPTHINLDLRFKELSTPTKETSPSDKVGV
jgi:hypothetical protein